MRTSAARLVGPLLVAATLLPAAPAAAHSAFLGSSPQPGQRLSRSPRSIELAFTEPLVRGLSKAEVVAVAGGRRIPARLRSSGRRQLALHTAPLDAGAYRVRWHTVSTDDGHALEGSFSFGVRAPAAGSTHSVEQSALARGGALRVVWRLVFYVALLFFAGGLLLQALLPVRRTVWIVPPVLRDELGVERWGELVERHRTVLVDAGLAALGLGAAVALLDAGDAAGGFSARREWQCVPGTRWRPVGTSGGVPFRTRSWFRWTPYAVAVRLLALDRRRAAIALMDPATPAWIRLRIDRRTGRVLRDRLVTKAESWLQRYSRFNRPITIHARHER